MLAQSQSCMGRIRARGGEVVVANIWRRVVRKERARMVARIRDQTRSKRGEGDWR